MKRGEGAGNGKVVTRIQSLYKKVSHDEDSKSSQTPCEEVSSSVFGTALNFGVVPNSPTHSRWVVPNPANFLNPSNQTRYFEKLCNSNYTEFSNSPKQTHHYSELLVGEPMDR